MRRLAVALAVLLVLSGCSMPSVTLVTIVMPGARMQVGQQNITHGESTANSEPVGSEWKPLTGAAP